MFTKFAQKEDEAKQQNSMNECGIKIRNINRRQNERTKRKIYFKPEAHEPREEAREKANYTREINRESET